MVATQNVEAWMNPDLEVTIEQVRHVARLANLELTADEESRMQRDLSAILGHIAHLDRLSTAGVPAMAQVSEVLEAGGTGTGSSGEELRRDVRRASVDRAAVLAEAPETDGRFFKVLKVVER